MTEFEKDIREKKQIGNSARHKVVSGGRRVGFPSDGLTKKEREALNSEVRSWNTKRVMPWGTYKQMPGDLQKEYLSNMRGCGATATWLAAAMGVNLETVRQAGKRHGVAFPRGGEETWCCGSGIWTYGATGRPHAKNPPMRRTQHRRRPRKSRQRCCTHVWSLTETERRSCRICGC